MRTVHDSAEFLNPQRNERESRRRLAIEIRAHGMRGVSTIHSYSLTAAGKATRTVNLDRIGMSPADQHCMSPEEAGLQSMENVARYRSMYKGDRFAKSQDRSAAARRKAAFLRDFPYWPHDASGRIHEGRTGRTGRRYFDLSGSRFYLSDLYRLWAENEGKDDHEAAMSREAELRMLADSQALDDRETRKHSKRTGMVGR